MTEKMIKKHINSSIFQGFCPSCGQRKLKYPKNPESGGLECTNEKCPWKNIYYIGPAKKSKSAGSSAASNSKPKPNNAIIIDMTNHNKRYKTGICYTCDHAKYPGGKVIDPITDKYSRINRDGTWTCGTCVNEETIRLLRMMSGGRVIE